jgi:hypothetical protein
VTKASEVPTGRARKEILFRDRSHPQRDNCPACGENLMSIAIIRLAYVFTGCECKRADYRHLYEQLWHLTCLRESGSRR